MGHCRNKFGATNSFQAKWYKFSHLTRTQGDFLNDNMVFLCSQVYFLLSLSDTPTNHFHRLKRCQHVMMALAQSNRKHRYILNPPNERVNIVCFNSLFSFRFFSIVVSTTIQFGLFAITGYFRNGEYKQRTTHQLNTATQHCITNDWKKGGER